MAKFCGNCGAKLDDDAKVCGQCGTPLENTQLNTPIFKQTDPEKEKKIKKIVKIALALIALIIVVRVVIGITSRYTGHNGLLRKVMAAYEDYDIDTLVSLSSDLYYCGKDPDADWAEHYFENIVGDHLEYFESSVGHSYKLSYKVNETYPLPERKFSEMLDEIESTHPDFDSEIKKIVVADLELTAKQGNKSKSTDLKVIMAKEDGKWKLLYIVPK